jgi:hypothetical protein
MSSSYLIAHSLTFSHYELSITLKYVFGLRDYVPSNIPLLKRDMANLLVDRINYMFKVNFKYYSKDIEFYKFYTTLKYNEESIYVDITTSGFITPYGEWS